VLLNYIFFVRQWYLQLISSAVLFWFKISRPKHVCFTCFSFSNSLHFLQFRIQICLDSWVSIVTSSMMDDKRIMLKFWQMEDILCLHCHNQTVSEAHPASYIMGTAVFSKGIKQLEHKPDHSYLSVLTLIICGAILEFPLVSSWYDA
jgi:hypothetical protein